MDEAFFSSRKDEDGDELVSSLSTVKFERDDGGRLDRFPCLVHCLPIHPSYSPVSVISSSFAPLGG